MKEIIEADTDPMKEVLCHVKFGPRRETVKDIIEADPMKEVLHLRATFAPSQKIVKFGPRRETMKANSDEQDVEPKEGGHLGDH